MRAAAVIVAWTVLRHFYPYFDVIGEDWDAALAEALADVLDDRDAADTQATLARLVAKLHDGHGRVSGGPRQAWLPLELARVEGEIVVVHAEDDSGLRPGDVIVEIDGAPVEAVLADAATRKMALNARRYPADLARGRADKYDRLQAPGDD